MGISGPDTVPAGRYAQDVLMTLGIWEAVKAKLVFAEDVRQVLKYVETENIDVGIVYQTDAAISDKVKILDRAPGHSHLPVILSGCGDEGQYQQGREYRIYKISPRLYG